MTFSPNPKQYKISFLVILALIVLTTMTFVFNSGVITPSLAEIERSQGENLEPVVADFWRRPTATQPRENAIGGTPSTPVSTGAMGETAAPALDYASIEEQLLKIKVDENGEVILDRDANNRITAGFYKVPLPLSPELLATLQHTITQSLPSPLGGQVADIIAGYHDYLVAIKNESDLFGEPSNLGDHKRRLEQKMELQTLILGESNASKLFAQENADQMYMLEGMEVATNPDLSPEQRTQLLAELEQQRQQMKPAISNWDSRYEQFERNREAIEDAALSKGDKTRQIRSLYRQSFDMAERAQIEEMGAVSLN